MNSDFQQFVAHALAPEFPPAHPLRLTSWAGLAFDRNRYETFAPQAVWDALLAVHRTKAVAEPLMAISHRELETGGRPHLVAPSVDALMIHLTEDSRFLQDHYLTAVGRDWLRRLDQDVTLIAGERLVMGQVVGQLGGMEQVFAAMEDDFMPGPDDSAGLRRYLVRLVSALAE